MNKLDMALSDRYAKSAYKIISIGQYIDSSSEVIFSVNGFVYFLKTNYGEDKDCTVLGRIPNIPGFVESKRGLQYFDPKIDSFRNYSSTPKHQLSKEKLDNIIDRLDQIQLKIDPNDLEEAVSPAC